MHRVLPALGKRARHCVIPYSQALRTISSAVANEEISPSAAKLFHINLLPLWKGQKKQGVRYGPAILNAMAYELAADPESLVTNHYEDELINIVSSNSEGEYTEHMNQLSSKLLSKLDNFKTGDIVLNLGGDHSVSMATVQKMYHKYPDLRMIWVDAHADINSPETSESGNFHGMPVYYISNLSDKNKNSSQIHVENIAYIGLRDVDVAEAKVLEEHNIKNYTKEEIMKRGWDATISELIEKMELHKYPVHISFDIDSVDPSECPSTGTAVPDGLSISNVIKLINQIKKTGNLVSLDLVEFNPLIGSDREVEKTVQSIRRVMREIIC